MTDLTPRQGALDRVRAELSKPVPTARIDEEFTDPNEILLGDERSFNPWEVIDCFYGCYSNDFDDCAIEVLSELIQRQAMRDDLGARMFREILCTMDLCEYGTSPRVCFPTPEFSEILPQLLSKWEAYSKVQWR